nr:MAG TPA: hypothetical protein [Ackermannviridae sp.]
MLFTCIIQSLFLPLQREKYNNSVLLNNLK